MILPPLLSKMTHSFACKTKRIATELLQSIETITHAWSVSTALQARMLCSSQKHFLTVVMCRNTLLKILMIGISFHKLAFTVNTTALFMCSTCDIICKMEETIRM